MGNHQKVNEHLISDISQMMKKHYESTFECHGPSSAGVDWGNDEERAALRYKTMLNVLGNEATIKKHTLLDVGCGYGGLNYYAKQSGIDLEYTGIDIASNMVKWAKEHDNEAQFIEGDFLNTEFYEKEFDYVICNGILTQKLKSSLLDMDYYAKKLINKMFRLSQKGIAFNIMSTSVNYFSPNLYYKHPAEILTYCLSEVSKKIKIDHSYGLYEFTVYLFK